MFSNFVTIQHKYSFYDILFSHRDAETQGRSFLKAIDTPCNPGFHQGLAKIQQVPKLAPRQPQVRLNLLLVRRRHPFDRFQFQDNPAIDDDVCPEAFVEPDPFVLDRYRYLSLNLQPSILQLPDQNNLVNHFEKAGPSSR